MATRNTHHALAPSGRGGLGFGVVRTLVLGLARALFTALPAASTVAASPLPARLLGRAEGGEEAPEEGSLWVLYAASLALVLLGGAFAGLTIALMGQDSIYLQVLSRDDTDPQQANARRVHALLQRGKHWVLVTLLLSNVIVNETLPVVLDRCLGGGVAAVVGSTVLIVIFGEVLPQSVCVRYGLQIGGIMAKPVLALMWLMAPIAWPTAKVLDHALGQDHGTVYKKSGLKTLVTLHRSLGEVSERLNQDEVTIISAVLDLKEKPVSSVMTPMDDVFTMSEETVLDEAMMDLILSAGYSRIPIHEPNNPTNFVGMLLVKILITYDPDDKMRVSEFPLATLPETRPETSCLDLVNFFQEGKSHMVLVSQYPGEDHGALGVVTLEDVIEELIGEEIIDESDVYIDVHKAIRRLQPAPRARPMRRRTATTDEVVLVPQPSTADGGGVVVPSSEGDVHIVAGTGAGIGAEIGAVPGTVVMTRAPSNSNSNNTASNAGNNGNAAPLSTTVMMRRMSAGADGRVTTSTVPVRANIDEMWQHLRHLGPSNRATNPKNTRSATVKIKTGLGSGAHARATSTDRAEDAAAAVANETTRLLADHHDDDDDGRPASTSVLDDHHKTLRVIGYGAQESSSRRSSSHGSAHTTPEGGNDITTTTTKTASSPKPGSPPLIQTVNDDNDDNDVALTSSTPTRAEVVFSEPTDVSVVLSSPSAQAQTHLHHPLRPSVRSGSITENVIETRGIRKVILETTSSTDEEESGSGRGSSGGSGGKKSADEDNDHDHDHDDHDDADHADGTSAQQADGTSTDGAAAAAATGGGGAGAKKRTRRKKRKNGH